MTVKACGHLVSGFHFGKEIYVHAQLLQIPLLVHISSKRMAQYMERDCITNSWQEDLQFHIIILPCIKTLLCRVIDTVSKNLISSEDFKNGFSYVPIDWFFPS